MTTPSSCSPEEAAFSVTPGSCLIKDDFKSAPSSPASCKLLPNDFRYYNSHINKAQFNSILINSAINLLKLLYPESGSVEKLSFFIVEILRRLKTSIQSLQICCYYIFKLARLPELKRGALPNDPKKLFLGLLIIASKFNQDHNYSFKSWLKICGCKDDGSNMTVQTLRALEFNCLQLLDYDCYINGTKYENWCNILAILSYDFIKCHRVSSDVNVIEWDMNGPESANKLAKWGKFLTGMNVLLLASVKVSFADYYYRQFGKRLLVKASEVSTEGLRLKRLFQAEADIASENGPKRTRVAACK